MSATKEVSIRRLGILAGGGDLPKRLIAHCHQNNIEPFVVHFEGQQCDIELSDVRHACFNIGAAGKIMNFFKQHDVFDLVMIGSIDRPKLLEMKPDLKGITILSKIGLKSMGDNKVLEVLETALLKEGFQLHGVHEFCDDILAKSGVIGTHEPNADDLENIKLGIHSSQELGHRDLGQAVVVQQGEVIAVEDETGTDNLIHRASAHLKNSRGKPILVKSRKPQQSKHLDLPTIGIQTLENASKNGFSGIAVHADNVIIVDQESVIEFADRHGVFLYGFDL